MFTSRTLISSIAIISKRYLPSNCNGNMQIRGLRVRPGMVNVIPYDRRFEITTEKSKNPFLWDIPDLQNPHLAEPDILYKTIELETLSHDQAVLNSYEQFLLTTANHLQITVSNVFKPKTINGINIDKIIWFRTLLRVVFVKRKYRVQYEARTYYRRVQIKHLTGSTADTFLEYVQRNLPEGVAMKVTKCQSIALPSFIKQPKSVPV